jgi:hypothetical protein
MLRSRGPVFALAALIALASYGLWLSTHQPPNQETSSSSEQRARQSIAPQSPEETIALYTEVLAWFTAVLAIVSAVQGIFLYRADKTARISADAANKAASAAEAHTAVVAAQTDVLIKQHAIGRLQHLALHRPRLRIRHVSVVDSATIIGHPGFFFDHGQKITGGLVIVNVGGTKTKIIESFYKIYFSRTVLPINSPLDKDEPKELLIAPNKVFDVGESLSVGIQDTIIMNPPTEEGTTILRRFKNENWKIYVMGQIRYQDEGDRDRFMGFCRVGDGETRFTAVDDPDYEYED